LNALNDEHTLFCFVYMRVMGVGLNLSGHFNFYS